MSAERGSTPFVLCFFYILTAILSLPQTDNKTMSGRMHAFFIRRIAEWLARSTHMDRLTYKRSFL
jgi:hypothetical protein